MIDDGLRSGYKAADVIPGRLSAVAYGEGQQENNAIRNDDLLRKANRADQLRRIIEEDVERLKEEDPRFGEEMAKVIKLKYLKNYRNQMIEAKLIISDSTLHRRRVKGLRVLENGGLHLLYEEIINLI